MTSKLCPNNPKYEGEAKYESDGECEGGERIIHDNERDANSAAPMTATMIDAHAADLILTGK